MTEGGAATTTSGGGGGRSGGKAGGRGGRGGKGKGKGRGGRGGRGGGGGGGGNNDNKNDGAGGDDGGPKNKNNNRKNRSGRGGNDGGNNNEGGGGRGGGGGGKNRRRNNKNKGDKKDATPQISAEEKKRLEEERKKAAEAEAERKRIEEEQKALEEAKEKLRKEKQELEAKVKEARDQLMQVVDTVTIHKENRACLSPNEVGDARKKFEASKKSLKSDLKKCTAFVKKVKTGGAWSMRPDDIVRDVSTLNLSRYVEEVVAAILEAKLKLTDIPVVLALCKSMYLRYPEFLPNLTKGLWSVVQGKPTEETAKLRRVYVRIITELLLNGISTETKSIIKLVTESTGGKDGSYAISDVAVVVAFVKAGGFEIFGVVPKSVRRDSAVIMQEVQREENHKAERGEASSEDEVATSVTKLDETVVISDKLAQSAKASVDKLDALLPERGVSDETSELFLGHCKGAYQTLSASLIATHAKLQKMEKRCEQDRLLQGSLSEQREKNLGDARKLRESLLKSVEAISDVLDLPMPKLEDDDSEEANGGGAGLELWTKGGEEEGETSFGPFDDEETRAFYCDIPDFLTTIPPALLGMSQDEIDKRKADNLVKYGSGFDNIAEDGDAEATEVAASSEAQLEAAEMEEEKETAGEMEEEATDENKDTPHYKLMVLLEQELPECSRREQIDEIAEKFCTNHGTSKNSRKRLSQTLFHVPRARLDLLPYYSRMAATLCRVWPDVSSSLATDLEQQFHGQAKYKKNQNIESRLRTARYIGELTKFRVAPPIVALRCIRRCLDDFTGGNVDVACCVLESCGRYLYRLSHTNAKLSTLMEAMMRLSKAKHLDERHQALINTAFFTVKPPASGPKKAAKVYPPLEGYLRHLLMDRLQPTESSIAFVAKQLIRFPWSDTSKQCGFLICKIMIKACRRGRYKVIQALASVAAKLRRHKPEVCIRLVDAVLEDLQWSIEHPAFKDQQRTITIARLLGELYCSSLASGQLIIQQLYKFINFGHEIPEALREASAKHVELAADGAGKEDGEQYQVTNSASGAAQTIQEDEEMEDALLDPTEAEEESPLEPSPVAVSSHSKFDPRVPSVVDPPNSVFRIKLVCTLLEVVSKTIITRNNLTKIEGFLAAFQRYLFTKTILPTEVEFSLLDTFDMIDSQWKKTAKESSGKGKGSAPKVDGFPRYVTWLEAHNVTVRVEETEVLFEERAKTRLEAAGGGVDSLAAEEDGLSIDDDDEDDSMDGDGDDFSADDALSASAKDSLADDHDSAQLSDNDEGDDRMDEDDDSQSGGSEDEDDSDEDESGDDTEDDDASEEEEFDEQAYMAQLEEEAFERELRRLTMDALEKGKATTRGGKVADDMVSGSQFIKKKTAETVPSEIFPSFALGGKEGVKFQLLKKGNKGKMEAKQFFVPSDTNLAAVATKQDDEAARERDMIKARVLQYEAESAELQHSGGNVYLEQEKLQVIRNRPLSMEEIDRNFGTTGGNLRSSDKPNTGGGPGGRGFSGGRTYVQGGRGSRGGGGRTLMGGGRTPLGRGGRGARGGGGRTLV